MLFGNKDRFAIEFELDANHGGAWLFGRFCYWIAGEQVGDYDAGTSLRDVLFQMKYIVGDAGKRSFPRLAELPAPEIFRMVSDALSERNSDISQYVSPDFSPAYLDVNIPMDIFGCWDIFLVDGLREARLIYRENGADDIKFMALTIGEFDSVVEATQNELQKLLAQEDS
ncbi:immunity 42 family protein [Ralstonia mannitolilytica]|uniref:Uncharacterized protein n=1 Tax=Ralstonia mannitolilytica TaxID=105219 RepID=A0AAD2AWL6_9RALS|nr:immunity 42 family protein [Ralstonia mannitolilytica]MBY4720027.1 immunity 42 family protein [Ralstonia mannitolilytica]CAJ0691212.1 hypothetical protein R77591_03716 [Ralstonia mannitolilytica]CAJ0884846.1 hypothetical protein R77569_03573 [Ralstonia mannitolilytica]